MPTTSAAVPPTSPDASASDAAPAVDPFLVGFAAGVAALEAAGPVDPFLSGEALLRDLTWDVPVPRHPHRGG